MDTFWTCSKIFAFSTTIVRLSGLFPTASQLPQDLITTIQDFATTMQDCPRLIVVALLWLCHGTVMFKFYVVGLRLKVQSYEADSETVDSEWPPVCHKCEFIRIHQNALESIIIIFLASQCAYTQLWCSVPPGREDSPWWGTHPSTHHQEYVHEWLGTQPRGAGEVHISRVVQCTNAVYMDDRYSPKEQFWTRVL